jgi:hypothetical protein
MGDPQPAGRPALGAVVKDYLLLGLRLGRLIEGYVDCWFGDPALARQVAAEPPPEPAVLARQAREVTAALAGSGLAENRQRFLAAQLRGLRCAARRLAGERIGFLDEVEEYFDVRIAPADTQRYAALHDELAAVLPGPGPLHRRVVDHRAQARIAGEALGPAIRAVSDALRARLATPLGLPDRESVEYVIATDRPWNAFNRYLGGFRSRITLNADAGHWTSGLAIVASHEAYPGHHAERCLKERGLVVEEGHGEQAIALVNTAQCLVSEGTAELGLAVAGQGWGEWTEEVLRPLGLHLDGAQAERIDRVMWLLTEVRQDAAIMLHDRGADPGEVVDFLSRWMLVDTPSARRMLRFLGDPLWRAYTTTYVEGRRLVGRWLAARPAGQSLAERYRRLLTEPLLPATLRMEAGHADEPDLALEQVAI